MFLNLIKKFWEFLNKISPSNRNLLIILLMGYIFYSQITVTTLRFIHENLEQKIFLDKEAELYTKDVALELNQQVQLIADKDEDSFDVLLLNYHNNTQSLQGFKYLYLSCLTEAPKTLDTPLLKSQWNNIDYIYYADELLKIHSQSYVQIKDLEDMRYTLPKLYHLVKASDAKAISFFGIEGKEQPIGMIVILYNKSIEPKCPSYILPIVQRLAILLDYENIKK